ncbi:MAG TPA: hypothetical protein PLG31_15185 [Spirochaetota bacterium]|nr:hypothetical protein [Spirochaetota bacterium]
MNMPSVKIIKDFSVRFLVYPILFALGMGIGAVLGGQLIDLLLYSNKKNISLLYRPAKEYIQLANRLQNPDEYNRITSYYLIQEVNRIDVDFLAERYRREERGYLRRTIIWVIGFSGDLQRSYRFFDDIYSEAEKDQQREILRSLRRLNRGRYHEFIKRRNIPDDIDR